MEIRNPSPAELEWWRCRKWTDYITATNDEPPEHPKLESAAANSGLDIYAEPRSTALLLAVRTAANLETRHAHLQKTAHSRADGVFVRHSGAPSLDALGAPQLWSSFT